MKKKDFIIVAAVLVVAAVLALVFYFTGTKTSNAVQVKVDGVVTGTYSLAEDREVPIDTEYGHNLLVIEDGAAYMKEADCPDGYCMDQGRISKGGKTIVCLPHKVVVETVNNDNEVDAVVQ